MAQVAASAIQSPDSIAVNLPRFSVAGEPGTLDQHLKRYLKRDVARWLARVLNDAGVVDLSERPGLSVQLAERFRRRSD